MMITMKKVLLTAVAITVCSMAMAQSGQESYEKSKECFLVTNLRKQWNGPGKELSREMQIPKIRLAFCI